MKAVTLGQSDWSTTEWAAGQAWLPGRTSPSRCGADIGSGLVKENGEYVATSGTHDGLPVGDYRVIVTPPRLDPKEEQENEQKNTAVVMQALISRNRKDLEKVSYPQEAIVPQKYWRDTTSGLTFQVKEGQNTAPLELASDPDKKK
ncbi:MAG: hypothetical protein U0992_04905 [Planctomycetaceae bacterium]